VTPVVDTLAIVGVGLMGGSLGLAARAAGAARHVFGIDRDPAALAVAHARGAVTATATALTAALTADLVVVCTPVDRVVELVRHLAAQARPGTLFTDVGSTKTTICTALADLPFIGGHPLAGSEQQGVGWSRADLFNRKTTVLTPMGPTPGLDRLTAFWQALGTRVVCMTPTDHDQALAWTSHLPHLLATLLAAELPPAWDHLTATGFRDTTRIAAGSAEVWGPIFQANASAVTAALERFVELLHTFRQVLPDAARLQHLLDAGRARRLALDHSPGPHPCD
jgi:prephenate dehydrogenase